MGATFLDFLDEFVEEASFFVEVFLEGVPLCGHFGYFFLIFLDEFILISGASLEHGDLFDEEVGVFREGELFEAGDCLVEFEVQFGSLVVVLWGGVLHG